MNKKGAVPAKGGKGADLSAFAAKYNLSEEDVAMYKQSFDLFDTDQGGSIDTKGKYFYIGRIEGSYGVPGFRIKECNYFPNDF